MRPFRLFLASLFMLGAGLSAAQADTLPRAARPVTARTATGQAAPAPYYYSTYERFGANILWMTCGYNATSEGCFGSGDLGPFGRPCAVAGEPQLVVVADSVPGNSPQSLLYFYTRNESATPSATLAKTVAVAIPSSATATCHLAVNGNFAYFGTSASSTFYKIDLRTYALTSGSSCGGATSAITVSDKAVVVSQSNCYTLFDSAGTMQEDGGQSTNTFAPGAEGFAP